MLCKSKVLCSQAQVEHYFNGLITKRSFLFIENDDSQILLFLISKTIIYRRRTACTSEISRNLKSLLSLLFCYKCLYFHRQDSRLSCPKYSSLFVFVSSRMHAEECSQTRQKLLRVRLQTSSGMTRMKTKNKETKERKKNKRAIACAQGCLRSHVTQRFLHDRQGTNAPSSVPQRLLLAAWYSNKNQFSLSDLSPVSLRHKEASSVEERGTDKGWFSPATESESES